MQRLNIQESSLHLKKACMEEILAEGRLRTAHHHFFTILCSDFFQKATQIWIMRVAPSTQVRNGGLMTARFDSTTSFLIERMDVTWCNIPFHSLEMKQAHPKVFSVSKDGTMLRFCKVVHWTWKLFAHVSLHWDARSAKLWCGKLEPIWNWI